MITWRRTAPVQASAEDTFDVIGTNVAANQPKWEKEVQEVRLLTAGPIGVGSRAVMVRREMGRTRESEYEVTEFQPGASIAFRHPHDALGFALRFRVAPVATDRCELTVDVSAEPKGALRLMAPMLRLGFPKRCQRITDSMIQLVEASAS
ncbi:MAG TPA: SRPBCC family protein [Actinomycetota bacterium]|nr:SRPBCC family protein [Actinomycetota bacterium]